MKGVSVMDEMKITTKLMRGVLSKLATNTLTKKFGYGIDIRVNEVSASIVDGKAHIHLSIDSEISSDDLTKILKQIGLY